ncbi:uncharacterized protein [Fopius arisanus]|uniref:Uncharacterized protein n=1 Tax=Fopius arisanus TaxID=64838 RepID=A0A9R1U526_9HYME|nr:PREDICTED: uncharacterized protein LOC105269330 [Fopius arisanus]
MIRVNQGPFRTGALITPNIILGSHRNRVNKITRIQVVFRESNGDDWLSPVAGYYLYESQLILKLQLAISVSISPITISHPIPVSNVSGIFVGANQETGMMYQVPVRVHNPHWCKATGFLLESWETCFGEDGNLSPVLSSTHLGGVIIYNNTLLGIRTKRSHSSREQAPHSVVILFEMGSWMIPLQSLEGINKL